MRVKLKNSYNAALYLRLSREDGDKVESDSIQNQRELIRIFLEKHPDIKPSAEFVDDGYSGTNYERPGFSKMMEAIGRGEIDCIVVKDLSRLGRNYIETGRYLERIFPMLEVRFIAINDSYDNTNENEDADDIIVPFKNLINDSYCRDISMKIRSQIDVKRKSGKFIGRLTPYGYKKDPNDKNHLVIDEYAAGIVRKIFDMKLQGYNESRIADCLNAEGVLTPMLYKQSCGIPCSCSFLISDEPKWIAKLVSRILKNEDYVGTLVQGKRQRLNYKIKGTKPLPPEEWIRVENAHEPIVSKLAFDSVQKLLRADTRTSPYKETVDIFAGMVQCGTCGRSMTTRKTKKTYKNGTTQIFCYYHCLEFKEGTDCDSSHLINAQRLYEIVLKAVQNQVSLFLEAEALVQGEKGTFQSVSTIQLDQQVEALRASIEKYSDMKVHLYQDKIDGVLSPEEYEELVKRFDKKIEQANESTVILNKKKEKLKVDVIHRQPWVEMLKEYGTVTELDRKLVVMLIDKIIVYSKNEVEVCFNFADEMETMVSAAEKIQKEQSMLKAE